MVRVRCSHCRQTYQVPEERLGTQATCKKCQHTFMLEVAADETGVPRVKLPSSAAASSGAADIPQKLGPYLLQSKIGAGAMGEVWLARDEALERDAALKLMAPNIASDPERRQRFEREAKLAARLLHPNTVAVYSFGVEGEHAYLAMEFVDGSSLDKIVSAGGPLPWFEASRLICDAARGLTAAHQIGLVHRDIKPANLMRTSKGVTKVVDFGLARTTLNNTQLTQDGTLLGTPAFMAPEQWTGSEIDARSDLYSLICSYYFLLTGRLPFDAPSLAALGYQHRYEPFPDARQRMADLPDCVCRILIRGAQKEVGDRYQTAGELVADLESLLATPQQSSPHSSSGPGLVAPLDSDKKSPKVSVSAADSQQPPPVGSQDIAKRVALGGHRMRWIIAAAVGLAMLSAMLVYVATNHGTIKIELSDPAAKVEARVDGVPLVHFDEPLQLSVREHELVVEGKNFETTTKKFTVKRGTNPALTIHLVPRGAVVSSTPAVPAQNPPDPTIPIKFQRLKATNLPGTHALQFDGKQSRVRIPRSSFKFYGDTSLTIEAIVVPPEVFFPLQEIVSDLTGGSGFHLGFGRRWIFGYLSESDMIDVRYAGTVVGGQRVHLAAIYDKDNRELRLFVDGRLNNAVWKFTKPYRDSGWDTIIGADPNHPQPQTFVNLFGGSIEQVSISRVARYAKDFEPERVLRGDTHTLVLYHFNEGEGFTAYDSSGKGNHASIEGAQWVKVKDLNAPPPTTEIESKTDPGARLKS